MYILSDYDDALKLILDKGAKKTNRTGVATRAIFCMQSRYQINEYFPIATGRKLKPEAIFAELLWFLSGSSNNEDLKKLGANFWTPWVDENFEKKHNFVPGSFGPLYGFQLRNFGGSYNKGIKGEGYGHKGVDQLKYVLDLLKNSPDSRRILWSLWNPQQMHQMRLPPCHYSFQFYVEDDKLSGVLTQRSCDFPVGVPFNIAFYSALIYMVAQQTGFKPHEFIHWTADSHIYEDQIPAVKEYLDRDKPDSPKLKLKKADDIDSYNLDHFKLEGYKPQPILKIPVAV
jgi:thymidylate synthase